MYNQTPFTLRNLAKCSLVLRQLGRNSASMQETSQKIADYIYQYFYDSESSQNSCVLVRLFKTHPYGELDDSLQASARSLMQNKIPPYEMKCWTLLASAGKEPQCNYADEAPNIVIPLVNEELVAQMLPISERILELGLDIPTVLGIADEKMLEMEPKLLNIFYICSAQNSPFIAEQNSLVIPYEVKSVLGIGGLLPSRSLFMVELFFNIKISFKIAEVLNILAVAVKTALLPFDGEVVFNNSPNTPIVMATNKIVPREILEASQLIGLSRVLDFYQEEMVRHASRLQSIIGKLKDKVDERHKQPF
ncbi:histidine kinase [Microcoleus sp.]|uniref:histidine kinase n=1 Tax=Microcoleus sp. TaxID=44472 RepID=UPI00352575A3